MLFFILISLNGGISLNIAQNFYSESWSGTETGSIIWMLMVDIGWGKHLSGSLVLNNTFKSGYGQTYSQSSETGEWLPPVKSTDRIENETVLKLVKGWAVDPFTSLTLQSQFYDNTIPDTTLFINPITITLGAGASRTILKNKNTEVVSRIGYAMKQSIERNSENSRDGGIEWITEAQTSVGKNVKYNGRLKLYRAFYSSNPDPSGYWKSPDLAEVSYFYFLK